MDRKVSELASLSLDCTSTMDSSRVNNSDDILIINILTELYHFDLLSKCRERYHDQINDSGQWVYFGE